MAKRSDAGRWVASRWLVLATAAAAWIGAAPSAFHAAAGTAASGQPLPIEGVDRFITVNGLKLHYLDWGNERQAAVHPAPRHLEFVLQHLDPRLAVLPDNADGCMTVFDGLAVLVERSDE